MQLRSPDVNGPFLVSLQASCKGYQLYIVLKLKLR